MNPGFALLTPETKLRKDEEYVRPVRAKARSSSSSGRLAICERDDRVNEATQVAEYMETSVRGSVYSHLAHMDANNSSR